MKYESYIYSDKKEIMKLLDNDQNIIEVIIGAINGIDDKEWLEELCLKYIFHEDFGIARAAIYGIGSIARIHGRLSV